jgi:fatty-acyl-CoA synthase
VIQFCRANLAGYKIPRHITFVDEFPRTAAGKIRKHLLAAATRSPSR